MRMLTQDLRRVRGRQWLGYPRQDVLQTSSGQRCSVEVPLQYLGGLGCVEAGRVIPVAACDSSLDCAGCERLGATFSHEGVDASANRIPDHFRQSRDESEGVKHHAGTVLT